MRNSARSSGRLSVVEGMATELLTATVLKNKWIPHIPTARQALFLILPHEEAFYGGAAGGGKSDGLLMAALQYVDRPGYSALLLRRTFADLALPGALLDRAHDWLGNTGARWRDQDKQWVFPTPAGKPPTLNFGYLEHDKDKYRYKSAEFQFIGPDETTQFSESQYTYLFSRLRRLQGSDIPIRMRSASNPGDIGHEWVKRTFVSPGHADRPFIQAGLADNPHIDQIAYRKSLSRLDEQTRRQLEEGIWDEPTPGGAYWGTQYEAAEESGRIINLPHDPALPVDTWWDLGTASGRDSMTAWFTQPDGRAIRAIRAYGVGGEGLPHMAQYLQSLGYTYRSHNAPHDIVVKEVGTGKTRLETAKTLGIKFEIVPQIGLFEGIQAARNIFSRVWFDRTNCAIGLRALKNYRKDWDERGQCWKDHPLKDWTNDYADGFRMLAVGYKERLPQGRGPGDLKSDYDPYAAAN